MTKKVFRYFLDFMDDQERWLNEMAAKGWRLVRCKQISYYFESCTPDEYEYAVEFIAGRSYAESKDYKTFLDSLGYKTFYKNIAVGIYLGKVTWRPWADRSGQIATSPGGIKKELIIVEKKKDGRSFELHTDLTDKLLWSRTIRDAYIWAVGGMFMLVAMCLSCSIWMLLNELFLDALLCAVCAIPCGALSLLCIKPMFRVIHKVRKLKEEIRINEYEAPLVKKKVPTIFVIATICVLFGFALFWLINSGGGTYSSGSVLMLTSTSKSYQWNANYKKLNGFRRRNVSLEEGLYTFYIDITTESGELNLSITGKGGRQYYKGTAIPTSTFTILVDIIDKDKLTLRVDAKNHSGSYKIKWD